MPSVVTLLGWFLLVAHFVVQASVKLPCKLLNCQLRCIVGCGKNVRCLFKGAIDCPLYCTSSISMLACYLRSFLKKDALFLPELFEMGKVPLGIF